MFFHCQTTNVIAKHHPYTLRMMRRKREILCLVTLVLSFATFSLAPLQSSSARADTINLSQQKQGSSANADNSGGSSIDGAGQRTSGLLSKNFIPIYSFVIIAIAAMLSTRQKWGLFGLTLLSGAIVGALLFEPALLGEFGTKMVNRVLNGV